jgi:hypothetical protein
LQVPPACGILAAGRSTWGRLTAGCRFADRHFDFHSALGLAIDPYGRPTITGPFGNMRFSTATGTYSLDFDPDPNSQYALTTNGGHDAFVARFNPDGTLHEAFSIGGEWNEAGTAIAFDPGGKMHYTGYYGDSLAPNTYEVDFDPGLGTDLVATRGYADAFLHTLVPHTPQGIVIQLSLVLDGSKSVRDSWSDIAGIYGELLGLEGEVPFDGTVALNVLRMGQYEAHVVLPWTQMTQYSAPLVAWAVRHLPWHVESASNPLLALDHGLQLATQAFTDSGITPCWKTIHLLASQQNGNGTVALEQARDDALTVVNQINGVALLNALGRVYLGDHATGSTLALLGFAAEVHEDWRVDPSLIYDRLLLVLARESVCPGDFNRNGSVAAEDLDQFLDAWELELSYADWDMDGAFTQDDIDAFEAGYYNAPCPCP